MADKPTDPPHPERGWGMMFRQYFKNPEVIRNYAQNGRSTRSFLDEKRWAAVYEQLEPQDYVIIQFGHNDEKDQEPSLFTRPHHEYRQNLLHFVQETRSKSAVPILATPVCRRRFDAKGRFFDTHGEYPDVVRQVAREQNVPLLELHGATEKLIKEHGAEGSKKIFLWIEPGHYLGLPDGLQDDTHFSEFGARAICELAIAECRRLNMPFIEWLG